MQKYIKLLIGLLLANLAFAQVVMLEPKEDAVLNINRATVTIAGKPGATANLFVNGDSVAAEVVRIDGIADFISIPVPEGPVSLEVSAIGAGGRLFVAKRGIHVLGTPFKIISDGEVFTLPGDGISEGEFSFEVQDEWGYTQRNVRVVTAKLSKGMILNNDLDTLSSGTQISIKGGKFSISIVSPLEVAMKENLELDVNGLIVNIPFRFTMPPEPFIMVGGINGAAATLSAGESAEELPHFGILNKNSANLSNQAIVGGRVAFYASGTVAKDYKLTASLDTDRGYLDQVFVDVDPTEQYPVYGDASSIVYDAQSRSKGYLKLEQNDSYIMYGDFNTNLTKTEFAAYNRTFNGLSANLVKGNHKLYAFSTATDKNMLQEEIRGEGISGFYYLKNATLTRFSEKIKIITRDRYHSERILNTKNLTRFFDYDINYVDGTLMFKQPVAGIDGDGNPIFIVVSYEYLSQTETSLIGGVRYEGNYARGIETGTSVIVEEKGASNYMLYGFDTKIPITQKIVLKGEIAGSQLPDSTNIGLAYSTELSYNPTSNLSFNSYYRNMGNGFTNGSQLGADFERASTKYGVDGAFRSEKFGKFTSEYYEQYENEGMANASQRRVFNINAIRQVRENASLKLSYENASKIWKIAENDSSASELSHLLRGQYDVQIMERVKTTFEHEQNLNGGSRTKPTNSAFGVTYTLTKYLDVYWKYRVIQAKGVNRQSVLGFDSKLGENTQILAKYEIGGITGEERNRASIGLNNKWNIREDLILNIAIENAATVDSFEIATSEHQSTSLSFEYFPEFPLKAIGKYEIRDDKNSLQRVITLGGDVKLFRGFGAIVKLDHWENRFKTGLEGSQTRENYQAGVAFRPEQSDRWNIIAKLAYLSDRNSHLEPRIREDRFISSAHGYFQLNRKLGIGARVATRFVVDEEGDNFNDKTQTYFASLRSEYAFNLKWSTIMDMRYMRLDPLNESNFGFATEIDYVVMKNTQVGIGYIFKDYNDVDFSYLEYRYHNLYMSIHMKFSEDIFNWH